MPLFLLGLILLICLLAYSIVRYINSAEEDSRPVRERYPHAFPVRSNPDDKDKEDKEEPPVDTESYYEEDSFRGDIDHMIRNVTEDIKKKAKDINIDIDAIRRNFGKYDIFAEDDDGNNTVEFPKDNIENEKRKRGIHTDKE
jgi:hypothetical protein